MTLQKKLGRLKKKDTKLSGYINSSDHFPDTYDAYKKGLQFDDLTKENFRILNKMVEMSGFYDALKKRNVELIEALTNLTKALNNGMGIMMTFDKAVKLLKQLK